MKLKRYIPGQNAYEIWHYVITQNDSGNYKSLNKFLKGKAWYYG